MNESDSSLREKALKEPLHFKNVTILLSDPRMDNYWDYWIPQDDLDMEELKSNFAKMPGVESVNYYYDHERILEEWLQHPPEFVFNQCDEGYQNDEAFEPHLTAYMDMLGVPFTGPTTQGLVLVKDKSIVRGAAQSVGVPVPVEVFIQPYADIASSIPDDFPFPAFGKLGNASGSMGVIQKALAHSKEEAVIGLTELRQLHPDRPLLLQEFLSGREFSIAMVGNPDLDDFEVFPPVEVDYSGLDKTKYAPVQLEEFKRDGDSEFWQQTKEVRAILTDEQMAQIKEYARRMFVRTQCRDYARMDFRTDSRGQIKIMDVNPNCWLGGKYRMMAEWAGYAWPEILVRIVKTAQKRFMIEKARRDKKRETFEKNKKIQDERIANHITFATNGNSLVTNLLPQERS